MLPTIIDIGDNIHQAHDLDQYPMALIKYNGCFSHRAGSTWGCVPMAASLMHYKNMAMASIGL